MNTTNGTKSSESRTTQSSDEQLRAILYLLQSRLEQMLEDADRSYALLDKIGEKTELAKEIEKVMSDPLLPLVSGSMMMNKQLKAVVEKVYTLQILTKKDLIHQAFTYLGHNSDVRFMLVLKDDNEENRNEFFSLISEYEDSPLYELNPISLHFIPLDLVEEFDELEPIALN